MTERERRELRCKIDAVKRARIAEARRRQEPTPEYLAYRERRNAKRRRDANGMPIVSYGDDPQGTWEAGVRAAARRRGDVD